MEIEGEGRLRKVDVFNLSLFPSKHSNFTLHGYNLRDCVHQTLFHHTKTNPQKKGEDNRGVFHQLSGNHYYHVLRNNHRIFIIEESLQRCHRETHISLVNGTILCFPLQRLHDLKSIQIFSFKKKLCFKRYSVFITHTPLELGRGKTCRY